MFGMSCWWMTRPESRSESWCDRKKAFLGIFAIDRGRLKRKWSDDQSIALTFRQREVIVSWTLVLALDNTTLSPNTAWW